MKQRPITTLFMLMSVDGKISTGASDNMDVDTDFPRLTGVKEGLHQYYEIEQSTDLWSLGSGRVQAKLGVNERPFPAKGPVSFVMIDGNHLTEHGVRYFCALSEEFVLATTNSRHPAFSVREGNLHILLQETLDLPALLGALKTDFQCERLTIQTGGTLNACFLRKKLFDYLDVVIAPVLIGGKDTAALIDGSSLVSAEELQKLGILQLEKCEVLENSYLRLRYKVVG